MSEATVTSKGQVTIPVDIRRSLGVEAQDRIVFTAMPDGTVVLRAKNRSLQSLRGMLRPKSRRSVSVDEMNPGPT